MLKKNEKDMCEGWEDYMHSVGFVELIEALEPKGRGSRMVIFFVTTHVTESVVYFNSQ